MTKKSARDETAAMQGFSARRASELEAEGLSGYVLKKDSPSCGMVRVTVYDGQGAPSRTGRGLFAEALMERLPLLPVEEEARLSDARLRENFIERVFASRRLQSFFASRFTQGGLVAYHAAPKLQLMAHSPEHYRRLGRLEGEGRTHERARLRAEYESGFMTALSFLATPRRQVNVFGRGRLEGSSK